MGRGSTFADIDGDGDLDVLITENGGPAHLFRNDGGNKNHWLRLELQGTSSRTATPWEPGSSVEVGGLTADVASSSWPRATSRRVEHPLTFGLGKAEKADKVTIVWPSGARTELRTWSAANQSRSSNQVLEIQENDAAPF